MQHGATINEQAKQVVQIHPQDIGATATKGAALDMKGFMTAEFAVHIGSVNGTVDAKVQQSDTTTDGDFGDITGAAASQWSGTDDNHTKVICVVRPTKRYIRVVVTPGTATVCLASCEAYLYGVDGLIPVTLDPTVSQLVKVMVN